MTTTRTNEQNVFSATMESSQVSQCTLSSCTLLGGSADNMPIGQTTPAPASFTSPGPSTDSSSKAATTQWVQSLITTAAGHIEVGALKIKWGQANGPGSGVPVSFSSAGGPAFTTSKGVFVTSLNYGPNATRNVAYLTAESLTGFTVNSDSSTVAVNWIAVGY
jgi:hypothetical protein